jgi:hypothetical protein
MPELRAKRELCLGILSRTRARSRLLEVCSSPSRLCQNPLFQPPPIVLKTRLLACLVWEFSPVPEPTDLETVTSGFSTLAIQLYWMMRKEWDYE